MSGEPEPAPPARKSALMSAVRAGGEKSGMVGAVVGGVVGFALDSVTGQVTSVGRFGSVHGPAPATKVLSTVGALVTAPVGMVVGGATHTVKTGVKMLKPSTWRKK